MPPYTETDLIRARRPLADASERGDAACTLGHLEAEQRQSPTAERAGIIREVTAHIATFDGAEAQPVASLATPAAAASAPTVPHTPALLPAPAMPASPAGGLQAGIAASSASMARTLRAQGITPTGEAPAGATIGATSMARTLRWMGLTPRAGA